MGNSEKVMDKLRANRKQLKGASDIWTDKRCEGECGRVLDLSEFNKSRRNFDGHSDYCRDCSYKSSKAWRQANPEKNAKATRDWYNRGENKKKNLARVTRYKLRKIQRTPSWSETDAITEFYAKCPIGYSVDHIVPLKGDNVSGLHVLSNLQYLPEAENKSKGNKHNWGVTWT